MISFLKNIPGMVYAGLAGILIMLGAVWYHLNTVSNFETDIANLNTELSNAKAVIAAKEVASTINLDTIADLEERSKRQSESISTLTKQLNEYSKERDDYVAIFRNHNLRNLSSKKPGLIETRINNGTRQVFRQLEQDSKDYEDNPYSDFIDLPPTD